MRVWALPGRRAAVERDVAQTWAGRLSDPAQRAMADVVLSAQSMIVALSVWCLGLLVALLTQGLGLAFVVAVLVGWVVLGVLAVARARAWGRLRDRVERDLAVPRLPPPRSVDLRHGVEAFDASVVRARAAADALGGGPFPLEQQGLRVRAREKQILASWGGRYDARAAHAQRLGGQWTLAQLAAALVGVPAWGVLAATGATGAPVVLIGLVVLIAVGEWRRRHWRRETQRAVANHLGVPADLAGRLPTKLDPVAFDVALAEIRRDVDHRDDRA
jgi:hypothetical protein